MSSARSVAIIPTSHLDLFWLGDYRNCLRRGDEVIRSYLDRAVESGDETFVIDTAIFAEHFLAKHPEYEGRVRQLIAEGRLEIGGAYIDRWENLVLAESIIRNIQIGRAWAKDRLGIDTRLAAHPDLPGLNAQTAQIYAQAGVQYYVTSRKIFHEGRVWRHRAPDGTTMTMLTWPRHYVFIALDDTGFDAPGDPLWLKDPLSYDDVDGRYPHGTIAVSGSAGDLTTAADLVKRYGKDMREYVGYYRSVPGLDVRYAIPATVLAPYLDSDTPLAEISGSLPSVWGVAPDEEMRFFHRVRALEALLLDSETASAIGLAAGRSALPESAREWRGLFAEDAFFGPTDTPPDGKEWEWLWRMHVFTQDHNGGGQDGPLSIFQKKVRHDRARGYALEVLDHALGRGETEQPVLLRSRLGRSDDLLVLDEDTTKTLTDWLATQPPGSSQQIDLGGGRIGSVARADIPQGAGVAPLRLATHHEALAVDDQASSVEITAGAVRVTVDKATGTVNVADLSTGAEWPGLVAGAYAVPELGNDVTMATDETACVDAELESVTVIDCGPVVARVRIRWQLLSVIWNTTVQVWADSARVDIETEVDWPAFENWQIRSPLAALPRRNVTHGTPFHASGWEDVADGVAPYMPDEISAEDLASYREVQHWLHLRSSSAAAGLAVLTTHPAFRHDGDKLEIVLLRTAPSCGDPRMAWTNPGRTTWAFSLVPVADDWRDADLPELADVHWRRPRVLPTGSDAQIDLLVNSGDTVRLSALYAEPDGIIIARLVNQSDSEKVARLSGAAIETTAELTDLDGNVQGTAEPRDGVLTITVPAWHIQTVRLGTVSKR